jgi:hypothetical protein
VVLSEKYFAFDISSTNARLLLVVSEYAVVLCGVPARESAILTEH